MPRIVRWNTLVPQPWKNGGGTAVDIAGQPDPGTVGVLDWRVNIATIAASGPFSHYAGVDRDFRVLDGGAVELSVEEHSPRLMKAGGTPYRFPGDRPTFARLIDEGEPCRAFNVLTRRGGVASRVTERAIAAPEILRPQGDTLVGVVRSGGIVVRSGSTTVELGTLDAFVSSDPVAVRTDGRASLILVHLRSSESGFR